MILCDFTDALREEVIFAPKTSVTYTFYQLLSILFSKETDIMYTFKCIFWTNFFFKDGYLWYFCGHSFLYLRIRFIPCAFKLNLDNLIVVT